MMFIFKYWKFGVGALAGALIMFGAMEARIWLLNTSHALDIESVKASIVKQCVDDKQLTKEVANDYQIELSDLNRRLAELKRVRPSVCVPIANSATSDNASTRGGHVDRNGIAAGELYDYAGEAERYRRQLIACQSFITKTWNAKKPH